ncbi:MAG: aminotransferase class I/II-fold pyridoxal phosphate-dependent enzyme [Candidatus Aenigmatarchaeota archaeon]
MIAKRMGTVEYAIRDLVVFAQKLEKQGKKIIYLNIGDPLKYDFATPSCMAEALNKAVAANHNYYSDSQGDMECRTAISEREKRLNNVNISPDNIIITSGVSEAISFVASALIEDGDEALVPGPSYPPYISYIKFFGGKPVFYKTDESTEWKPDIDDIEKKINEKTKFILLINPNNPTGAVYDKKTVKEIINIAGQHNLPLISDEVYDFLVFDGEFHSTASIAEDVPIIGFNGFSKSSLATGWRLGYMYFSNGLDELKESVLKLARIRLCASTPMQKAVLPSLRGDSQYEKDIKDMKAKLLVRRNLAWKRLNEIPNVSATKPSGAFYIFPKIDLNDVWKNDKEFVIDLLNTENVLVVNGSGFGDYGESHFRSVFLPHPDVLENAFSKIERFMKART